MSFFINDAYADAGIAGAAAGGGINPIWLMAGMLVIFYFMLIRPQQKRQKEIQNLLSALQKGDEVVFAGGLIGRIVKLDDDFVVIELATGVEVKVQRSSVMATLPKGTIKNI